MSDIIGRWTLEDAVCLLDLCAILYWTHRSYKFVNGICIHLYMYSKSNVTFFYYCFFFAVCHFLHYLKKRTMLFYMKQDTAVTSHSSILSKKTIQLFTITCVFASLFTYKRLERHIYCSWIYNFYPANDRLHSRSDLLFKNPKHS